MKNRKILSLLLAGAMTVALLATPAQAAETPAPQPEPYTISADHWSRKDFSQEANPEVFTGAYSRELYNASRQTMEDGTSEKPAYTMVSKEDYSAVKNLLGRLDGLYWYKHFVPPTLSNYWQYLDYFAVSAASPDEYQAVLKFIQPAIETAGQMETDQKKVEYLNKGELKEKAKSAPKELIHRGLGDGTERLRGQLREAAQRGQASDYGGDQIEDTAAGGANRAVYGMEILLKKKRAAKGWMPEEKTYHEIDLPMQGPAAEPSLEAPARPPSLHEPPPREQPQIKTREAVFAIEDGTGTVPSESSRARLSPGEQMRETRIKTRESAVHDLHLDGSPARQTIQELPQIRTMAQAKPGLPQIGSQDTIASASTAQRAAAVSTGMEMPPERLAIKTKNTYIQRQAAMDSTQPSQAFSQGQQKFMRERSRNAAKKRNEVQRTTCTPHAQGKAPPRRGYVGGQTKHAPAQAVRGAARSGDPAFRPVRDGGQTAVKTARSGKKTVERTAKQTIKTVERSSRQAIKTTQRTAKTVQHTVKTAQVSAQAAVKATQRAIQAARATAKAVAITAKVAAKVTVAAIKAAIAAIQALIAAIGAGDWVVLVIVLLICIVGLLIASPYGIFFSDSGSPDAVSPPEAIARINREYSDTLSLLQAGETYDRVEIQGRPPSWADVFAVFAVKSLFKIF